VSDLHLDTHVVVWLAAGNHQFPTGVRLALNQQPLRFSPMVRLELTYLHEVGRISQTPERLLAGLAEMVGLAEDGTAFGLVAHLAAAQTFTRDPFDRMITAQALAAKARLATKDRIIRAAHPSLTVWD